VKAAATALLFAALLPMSVRAQSGGSYFAIVDLDHDGRISVSEYIERFSYAFRQMDKNRDGVVDEGEQIIRGTPRMTIEELRSQLTSQFNRQDKNHDGSLSPREFLAPPG
jgi:Ca2+-binding EF-hand superfamily protein